MPPPVDPYWIRNPSDTLAIEEGCWFDADAGARVCAFIETFCHQSIDQWAGKPLTLIDWQRDFVMRLFGWKRPNGHRRFTTAYVEVAKKNGKSTLLAAIQLAGLLIDQAGAPEIHINACDRGQASIIFDESARMVRSSPALAKRLKVIDYKKRIVWAAGNGSIRANSADAPNKDGLNPSLIIFDELHRQPTYALWDIFEFASAARSQALRISITTAGEEEAGPWFDERDRSEKINAGVVPDTSHLGIVYRCDPDDDLDDPEIWRKANPSLGVTIDPEKFAREHEKAKRNPREFAVFKRSRFNIVTKSDSVFIPVEHWDACKADIDWSQLQGATAWIGADLSSTTDLTAAVLITGDSETGFDVMAHFWLPEDDIVKLQETDRVPYLIWAEQGFLTLTAGCTVDYFAVRAWLNARAGRLWDAEAKEFRNADPPRNDIFDIERLAFDPWNANDLAHALADADGFRVEYTRQGFQSANAPTKELERLVLAKLLRHDGHPILRWNISNAIAVTDAHSSIKLDKRKSRQKIDGAAALVNALAAAMTGGATSRSVYETRGVFTF